MFDVWFPLCIDTEHGGFLCDFDRRWNGCGPHDKLLEFQARQTLFAAEAHGFDPTDERLREAALHGFAYLRDAMWDADYGGWFHRLDRAGNPIEAHTKHTHGFAYAIQACAAVDQHMGSPGALDLAREGFEWMDHAAHDARYRGYAGFLARDGSPIRSESDNPFGTVQDAIGTPIGLMDLNVHSDMVEALAVLYKRWPDPAVHGRLAEIVDFVCAPSLDGGGGLNYYWEPDGSAFSYVRVGCSLQTVHRLITFGDVVHSAVETQNVAFRVLDQVLQHGWDTRASGFFLGLTDRSAPDAFAGSQLPSESKPWWVQAEGLKALVTALDVDTENAVYRRHLAALWAYLATWLDDRYGGMFSIGPDGLPAWRRLFDLRFAPDDFTRKGEAWKDASHEGRALLHCIATLR